jgi:hypothetical protein
MKDSLTAFAGNKEEIKDLKKGLERFAHSHKRSSEYMQDKSGMDGLEPHERREGLDEFKEFLANRLENAPVNPDDPKRKVRKFHPAPRLRVGFCERFLDEKDAKAAGDTKTQSQR